jgi:hypothetical protein
MGGRLVCEEFGGGVPTVEADPVGETTVVWMLALLLRLDPKPRFLKRELIAAIGLGRRRCQGTISRRTGRL